MPAGRPQPVEIEMPPEGVRRGGLDRAARRAERVRAPADPEDVRAAAATCSPNAERPLVWAGGGVVLGDATAELTAVAELPAGAGA